MARKPFFMAHPQRYLGGHFVCGDIPFVFVALGTWRDCVDDYLDMVFVPYCSRHGGDEQQSSSGSVIFR